MIQLISMENLTQGTYDVLKQLRFKNCSHLVVFNVFKLGINSVADQITETIMYRTLIPIHIQM